MSMCAEFDSEFIYTFACLSSPSRTGEVRLGEGGGLHPEEAALGLAAVLLRPQRPAVSQESRYAGTNARLHTGTGTAHDLGQHTLAYQYSKSLGIHLLFGTD